MSQALSGMLVVALEQAVAAPLCTSRLADAGARVIKIERPEGDFARGYDRVAHGESAYFLWLNRGKESLTLDIKDPADKVLLLRILARADVFVQNLAPGAAARAGFDPLELRARHPRLVTCSISGYGESGPYRDMKAYDMLIQAETGLADITGPPEAPGRVGVSVSDIAAGLNSYAAILEALLRRERTGEGATLAVSLFDATAEWMAVPLMFQEMTGKAPPRVGINHPSIAPYGAFRTGDGKGIVISIQNEREWAWLCRDILRRPELATDPRYCSIAQRVANRKEVDRLVQEEFARYDRAALGARLEAAGIAFGNLNTVADFAAHPHLRRITVEATGGPVSMPPPPARGLDDSRSTRIPALGADGEKIRREFAG
jgi:itaconate CoA-transferase